MKTVHSYQIAFALLSFVIMNCQSNFLPNEQQVAAQSQTEKQYKRVIEFSNFSLKLAIKSPQYYEKIEMISKDKNIMGQIFFSLNSNKKNKRGWKLTLNKVQLHQLKIYLKQENYDLNQNSIHILRNIFHNNIGRIIIKDNKISKIKLFQPLENSYCSFEVSQLRNYCWRIDIYPKKQKKEYYKYIGHLKFCAKNLEDQNKIRKFTYLLNNKQLGKTSKE